MGLHGSTVKALETDINNVVHTNSNILPGTRCRADSFTNIIILM